jgi:hypothetical protein
MHEHGCDNRQELTFRVGQEAMGNKSPLYNKGVPTVYLGKKEQNVQANQHISDHRKPSAKSIVITDWEHNLFSLSLNKTTRPVAGMAGSFVLHLAAQQDENSGCDGEQCQD